jgi:hypothetical protein
MKKLQNFIPSSRQLVQQVKCVQTNRKTDIFTHRMLISKTYLILLKKRRKISLLQGVEAHRVARGRGSHIS